MNPADSRDALRAALEWMATERGEVRMGFDHFIDALTSSGVGLATPAPTASLDAPQHDVAMIRHSIVDDIGTALSREFAEGSPFEPFDRIYVLKTITRVLDEARNRIRLASRLHNEEPGQ